VFKRKNFYDPHNEKTLWDLKRKIFGDESITTDNWIDIGMANI
jgi:hypothetical protein